MIRIQHNTIQYNTIQHNTTMFNIFLSTIFVYYGIHIILFSCDLCYKNSIHCKKFYHKYCRKYYSKYVNKKKYIPLKPIEEVSETEDEEEIDIWLNRVEQENKIILHP